jgi:hypothetical protein
MGIMSRGNQGVDAELAEVRLLEERCKIELLHEIGGARQLRHVRLHGDKDAGIRRWRIAVERCRFGLLEVLDL